RSYQLTFQSSEPALPAGVSAWSLVANGEAVNPIALSQQNFILQLNEETDLIDVQFQVNPDSDIVRFAANSVDGIVESGMAELSLPIHSSDEGISFIQIDVYKQGDDYPDYSFNLLIVLNSNSTWPPQYLYFLGYTIYPEESSGLTMNPVGDNGYEVAVGPDI